MCILMVLYVHMSSDSDSDGEERSEVVMRHVQAMNVLYVDAATIVEKYCETYIEKAAPRTSILSGMGWLQETLSTPGETYTMLRMKTSLFG